MVLDVRRNSEVNKTMLIYRKIIKLLSDVGHVLLLYKFIIIDSPWFFFLPRYYYILINKIYKFLSINELFLFLFQ